MTAPDPSAVTTVGVVCDTNIVISAALFPSSVPGQAFQHARKTARLLISPILATELHDVLARPKFARYLSAELRDEFLAAYLNEAEFVKIVEQVAIARDPDDNHVLDVAINGGARCIISGDDDLLTLIAVRDIPILKPADYLGRFGAPRP
ncbi:MAG TPA: putative toxin-antitoxin system toxin component, PIN family [Ktedonobacterales bacterium]|nr:putative toxin-antitoxin system toxin component, PIN family [Ktedonobacterales bacterium]